jgi:hypothetical protein
VENLSDLFIKFIGYLGKMHSEETKKKIAQKTKEAMIALKIKKASEIGLSLEAYEGLVLQQKKERKKREKKGLTDEGRKIMSEKAKERWQNPEFRRNYTLANMGSRTHAQITREKISATMKERWKNSDYRLKKPTLTEEARKKISATLKARWQEPEFRERMSQSFSSRNADWKSKIAERIKEKWQDYKYRNTVTTKLREYAKSHENLNITNIDSAQMSRSAVISLVKRAIRSSSLGDLTIQSIVGPQIWEEERVRGSCLISCVR